MSLRNLPTGTVSSGRDDEHTAGQRGGRSRKRRGAAGSEADPSQRSDTDTRRARPDRPAVRPEDRVRALEREVAHLESTLKRQRQRHEAVVERYERLLADRARKTGEPRSRARSTTGAARDGIVQSIRRWLAAVAAKLDGRR